MGHTQWPLESRACWMIVDKEDVVTHALAKDVEPAQQVKTFSEHYVSGLFSKYVRAET